MSENLHLAQAIAWNLATTLMTCITLFKGDGGYVVVESSEYDGDARRSCTSLIPFDKSNLLSSIIELETPHWFNL